MSTFVRHGAGSHFMRPDRVYRTGVIAPVTGFNPAEDVMSVAGEFTKGPYAFRQLDGSITLMGGLGFWDKIKLKIATWRASKNARRFENAAAIARVTEPVMPPAGPMATNVGLVPNGTAAQMAPQINPAFNTRVALLQAMAQQNMPSQWSANAQEMIASRWNGRGGR